MDSLFVLKGQVQQAYAKYSVYVDKTVQFVLALLAFYLINDNIGYMKGLASPVATLGFAVICTFLPIGVTVFAAAALVLAHLYTLSLGVMLVAAIIFFVIFIFFVKFTPKRSIIILLTVLAFMLKIPYVMPIAFGLLGTPICLIPIISGTIVFYLITYVKTAAAGLKGVDAAGLMGQISTCIKQIFQNKEMWVIVLAFVICVFVVYTTRRKSADHTWKIGMVLGAVVNIIVIASGDIILSIPVTYGTLVVGNVLGILIGLVLELLFFSVDYSRGEYLQYEDDEYYYYVKAVPKIVIAAPEKTVKRINKRHETEIIDTDEVRRKTNERVPRSRAQSQSPKKRTQNGTRSKSKDMEQMLLTQSLREELKLDERY